MIEPHEPISLDDGSAGAQLLPPPLHTRQVWMEDSCGGTDCFSDLLMIS